MSFDVITCGSATVDVFVFSDAEEKGKDMVYPIGAKMLIKDLYFTTGGGGTNTAVGFSRMGFKTGYLGVIGHDENSEIILKDLDKNKVSFLGVRKKDHSGYSIVLDSREHDRTILTHKGVNDDLLYSDISERKLKTDWFYFSSMVGKSFETQKKLALFAEKNGIKIAYNPSNYQTSQGSAKLKPILKRTEILVLNKEEAESLVKSKKDVFNLIHKLGPKIVCITDGKNGSEVSDGEKMYKAGVHKSVKTAERTGAGDAFASGFVSGFIKGGDISKAIQIGNANAEATIRYIGAKNDLLMWDEALNVLEKDPVKVRIESSAG